MSSAVSSLEGASVLVTGGAGFIGSHFVDRLVEENPSRITVVDNFFLGNEENLRNAQQKREDLEIVRLDAADLAAMQDVAASNDVDVVFDFAVIPLPTSLTYPAWTVHTNIGIVTTFCDLARRDLIGRYIHVSSSEAYGSARYVPMDEGHPHDAITPYAASKSAGDHIIQSYIETFGIDATIVRPFNNIGPRQNPGSYAGIVPIVVRKVLRGETIQIFGDGEQTRDFVYARDTADAIVSVFEAEACRREVLNVATGVGTSINELVRRILDVMDASSHPVEHVAERPGDVRRHQADVSKMVRLLGRSAPVISDAELAETVEWYKAVL